MKACLHILIDENQTCVLLLECHTKKKRENKFYIQRVFKKTQLCPKHPISETNQDQLLHQYVYIFPFRVRTVYANKRSMTGGGKVCIPKIRLTCQEAVCYTTKTTNYFVSGTS